jgi:ferric-dicitrate binding protein FerR (iron transport regulator)
LRDLLDGVFDEVPGARPSAEFLLGRLNVTVRVPQEDLVAWQRFEEGRIRFDETLRAKWPAPPPPPAPPPMVRRRRWPFSQVGMVLAMMAGAALWAVSGR